MRAFVTGFAGFIGSHLVDRLLADNWSVVGVDDFSAGTAHNITHLLGSMNYLSKDISQSVRIYPTPDVIFHLAAKNSVPRSIDSPLDTFQVNVQGTVNVLEEARRVGCKRIVLASSSSVYGDIQSEVKVEHELGNPLSPYAASKRAMELVAETYGRCYGMEIFNLRFFNVFGPRQKRDGPYAPVIAKWWNQRSVDIYGDGTQKRDFTYVSNVVDAMMLCTQPTANWGTYNIGGGVGTSLNALSQLMPEIKFKYYKPARSCDVHTSIANIASAAVNLFYEPRVSVHEGLHKIKAYEEIHGRTPR